MVVMKNTIVLFCLNILAFYSIKVAIRYYMYYYWLQSHYVTKLTYFLSSLISKLTSLNKLVACNFHVSNLTPSGHHNPDYTVPVKTKTVFE